MKIKDIIVEYGVSTDQVQGELLSAMMDKDEWAHINWEPMPKTQGYQMMSSEGVDPSFKNMMNKIFQKYLGVDMEKTITASTVVNEKSDIMKIIGYIQKNVNQSTGIAPKDFNINIDNYEIEKASLFVWKGVNFLVIRDRVGPPQEQGVIMKSSPMVNYHIYAANSESELNTESD